MIPKLTAVGKNLLLRALAGETIKFTNVQLGNGAEQIAENATELSNPLLTVPITQIAIGDDYVTLTAAFNNGEVESGFRITETGFFAEDPDDPENEILYALGNEGEGIADYVPANTDRISEMQFDALVFIGDAKNVTADINSSLVYASKNEFDEHVNNKKNPHDVTAEDVGLGSVPNVSTNDQTPIYETPNELTELVSGEKLSTAFGKIKLGISKFIAHLKDTNNPHGVTAEKIKAAKDDHKHSTADITSGTLNVTRGGTGATAAASARTNLGVPPISHASTATTYGAGNSSNYGHLKLSDAVNSTSGATGGIAATPAAVKQAYDMANQLSAGWTSLTLQNGAKAVSYGGRSAPSYKKIGNHVYIEGGISCTISSDYFQLATLPAGYRPRNNKYFFTACANKNIARIFVTSAGAFYIEWITKISDGSSVTGAIDWVQVSIDYFVD